MAIRTTWRRLPRALRWVLLGLPSALAGLMLLVNVALWTGLVERLVTGDHRMASVRLHLGRAWMLWPGTVHVRDLELDIDAYRYQLHLELPEGEADIAVLDLLSRTFHATRIDGDDATVVLLLKMPHDRVNERRLAELPRVATFDRPVRAAEPPDLPSIEDAFTVVLENVDAEVDRLWVDEMRLDTPGGRLEGNLRATSGHSFAVWDTAVTVEDAVLGVADRERVADGVELHLSLDIDEYDPFEVIGAAALASFSATAEGGGMVRDVSFSKMYLPAQAGGLALGGGEGPVTLRAALEGGVLQPDTLLEYRTDAVRLYAGKLVLGMQMHLAMSVAEENGRVVSRAGVDLDRLHGGHAGTERSDDRITAKKIEAFVAFAQTDLTSSDWPLVDARLSIPGLHLRDLADLSGAHEALKSLHGAVDLSWHTSRLKDGRLGHDATVKGRNVSFRSNELATHASVSARLGARTSADLRKTKIGKMHIELDDVGVSSKNGDSEGAWLRVAKGVAELDHRTGRMDARLHGRLDDLRPVFAHMNAREALAEKVADLELTQPLRFDVGLHLREGSVTLDIDELRRPALHVRGTIRSSGRRARYALELPDARIGIYGQSRARPNVDLAIPDGWLKSKSPWVASLPARAESG
jgi:hypothetical protein